MRRLLVALLCCICTLAAAQSDDSSETEEPSVDGSFALVFGESGSLAIVRAGRSFSREVGSSSLATVLVTGDTVTNTGTSDIEFVLYPDGQQVVLTPGSTVTATNLEEAELRLDYGRLLVVTVEDAPSTVETVSSAVRVEDGRTGVDQFVRFDTGTPVERVTTVSGNASVVSAGQSSPVGNGTTFDLLRGEVGPTGSDDEDFWSNLTVRPAPVAETVLDSFPDLREELEALLGSVPDYLSPPVAVAPGEVVVSAVAEEMGAQTPLARAAVVTEEPAGEESVTIVGQLLQEPIVTGQGVPPAFFSSAGLVLTTAGALTTAVGTGYSFFGEGDQLSRDDTAQTMITVGGSTLIAGIFFFTLSIVASN